jgi:hypothetical protein
MNCRTILITSFLLITLGIHAQQKPVEKKPTSGEELKLEPAQVKAMRDTIAAYEEAERIRKAEPARRSSSVLTAQQRMRWLRVQIQRRRMWRR